MNQEILDNKLDLIGQKLVKATEILVKEIPLPDMPVQEWNQTPIGRVVYLLEEALDQLEQLSLGEDE